MVEFIAFPKIPRLRRQCVITEKLDGTNAAIQVVPTDDVTDPYLSRHASAAVTNDDGSFFLIAQSRKRIIVPGDDNYGFALFVRDNAESLVGLGEGIHFGEWWGAGIQRKYGMSEKRFSLFNVGRWNEDNPQPECCHVVPTLYRGDFSTDIVSEIMAELEAGGSAAAPGFMNPEGVIVYHTQSGGLFKQTFEHDERGKEAA
jgi:hypothetical protein